jgi:hypothetical protein
MGTRLEILKGTIFGRLKVIKEVDPTTTKGKYPIRKFLCVCSCKDKTRIEIELPNLTRTRNPTESCGCVRIENYNKFKKECSDKSFLHHYLRGTYGHMIGRCYDSTRKEYQNYGGRGISVYKKWRLPNHEGIKNFIDWAESWSKKTGISYEGLELYREDNNGDYCPSNCRFITHSENNRNKRNNRLVTYKNREMTAIEAVETYGIEGLYHQVFIGRLKMGWSVKKSLLTPVKNKPRS